MMFNNNPVTDPGEYLFGDFTIPENLSNESATDGFAAMDWNYGTPAIWVTEEVMASLDPNEIKTKATKCRDELGTVKCGKCAHAMTATRWTPTN